MIKKDTRFICKNYKEFNKLQNLLNKNCNWDKNIPDLIFNDDRIIYIIFWKERKKDNCISWCSNYYCPMRNCHKCDDMITTVPDTIFRKIREQRICK
jgi:hypothetical protein